MRVALNGKQRSGKNTIGEMIAPALGLQIVGFADALKLKYAEQIGLPVPQDVRSRALVIDAVNHLKNTDAKYRTGLIELAENEKAKNPYIWVDLVKDMDDICVIDLRFVVEIERMKPLGTRFVRINRERQLRAKGAVLSNEDHYGECGLDDYKGWDYIVENNYETPSGLEDEAKQLISYLQQFKN